MELPITLLTLAAVFALGYFWGLARNDANIIQQMEHQRKRGDYWFDEYQAAINESWEYLGEWNDER